MRVKQLDVINDKVIETVLLKWRLHPVVIWLLSSIISLTVFALISLITGEFFSTDTARGYLEDYNVYHQMSIGVGSVVVFYFLLPVFIQQCFEQLLQNGVLGSSVHQEDYTFDLFLDEVKRSLSSRTLIRISFALSGLFLLIAVPQTARLWFQGRPASFGHIFSFAARFVFFWFIFGLAVLLALRAIAGVWWINQAFKRFKVVVRPLYPDGAGGLQPLSQFSIRLGYIIFFFGLELSMNQVVTSFYVTGEWGKIAWTPDMVLPWVVYLMLAPVVFFAPLAAAHDAMLNAKEEEMKAIANVFESEYKALRESLDGGIENLQLHTRKIEELQKLYNMVQSFPVWPFQAQKIAQFFSTVVSPLLLTSLSTIITTGISKLISP